jgi:hypothetical protein
MFGTSQSLTNGEKVNEFRIILFVQINLNHFFFTIGLFWKVMFLIPLKKFVLQFFQCSICTPPPPTPKSFFY